MPRAGALLGGAVVVAMLAGGGYYAVQNGIGPLPDPEVCEATANGYSVALSRDQAENASIIAAVAQRRGLPARAISIAMATAYQESKLVNIRSGDRDSLGLFQQRPSQGWGTKAEVLDPYYAANAFYDALVKVDGYQNMEITEAAQLVQRSAFPDAYADHEQDGRTIASAMSGYSEAAFTCTVDDPDSSDAKPRADGLTPRADAVRKNLEKAFGTMSLGGFSPDGVTSGHMAGSAHYDGRAIDIFFRPATAENQRQGWAVAHYLVANAARLRIDHVIYDAMIWSASRSGEGWRGYDPPESGDGTDANQAILEHRDHVHVDVA